MNKIKYILISILMLIGILIPGELYQLYMDNFNSFYMTTFYLQGDATKEKMLSDIADTAHKYNLQVFTMESVLETSFQRNVTIYCNEQTKNELIADYSLKNGNVSSVFSGSTSVAFASFEETPDSIIEANRPAYYLLGDPDDMTKMKQELVDVYGGAFPKQNDFSQYDSVRSMMLVISLILMGLICFINYYVLYTSQREYVVRASMGEPIAQLYGKLILSDTVFLCGMCAILGFIFHFFSFPTFLYQTTIPIFLCGLVLNALVSLRLFGFRVRAAFQNASGYREILISNYVVKIITCMASMFLLSLECSNIMNAIRFYQQRDFFRQIEDYQYCDFIGVKGETDNLELVSEQYYRTFYDRMLCLDPLLGTADLREIIIATPASAQYIQKWIPEYDAANSDENIIILHPALQKLQAEDEEELVRLGAGYLPETEEPAARTIAYHEDAKIISVSSDYQFFSQWKQDPIILLISPKTAFSLINDTVILQNSDFPTLSSLRYMNVAVQATKEELQAFAKQYHYEAVVTNAYSNYLYNWMIVRRTLYLNSILAILVLLLNVMINTVIIRMEFQVNAVELTVKKLSGFRNFESLRSMYLLTFAAMIVGFAASFILLYMQQKKLDVLMFCVIGFFLVSELLILHRTFRRYEKNNMSIILKGGRL